MSHVRLDRFMCERCKKTVDLEVGLEPEEWSRVTMRYPILEEHQPRLVNIGYDWILCDECAPMVLRLVVARHTLRDPENSLAMDVGDLTLQEMEELRPRVERTVEQFRQEREEATKGYFGPDTGHTFRIVHQVRGSSIVKGDAHHRDSDWFSEPASVEVRAWNLRDALHRAAELPFGDLMRDVHEGRKEDPGADVEPDDEDLDLSGWLTETLKALSGTRDVPFNLVRDTASDLIKRLRAEWEKTFADLKPHPDCAACQAYEAGESVNMVHDHEGDDDEAPYDRRDGYVPLVHFGVGRADYLEAACKQQVGIETVSSAPGKVTCRDCQDMISVPPTMRRENPWPMAVTVPANEVHPFMEEGRQLASEREDLIADGFDPADLVVPIAPPLDEEYYDQMPDAPEEPEDLEEEERETVEVPTLEEGESVEWWAPLTDFVGADFLLIDQHQMEVFQRQVITPSMSVVQATMNRIVWQGPRPRRRFPDGYVVHLTRRGLVKGGMETLCGFSPTQVDRQIGAGFTKHFDLMTCEDCRKAATTAYGSVDQAKGYFVHRADWNYGEQRPLCGTYEYSGHVEPCRPLNAEEQAEWDTQRAEDDADE